MRIASETQLSSHPTGLENLETLPHVRGEQVPTSMLYALLPSIIQNRIPRLPSIRRSVNDFRDRLNHARSLSTSAQESGLETPPPTYMSRQGSVTPNRWSTVMTDTEESDDTSAYGRPISSGSTLPVSTTSEAESGINWKYANQGLTLTAQAYQESSLLRDDEEGLPPFSRQLYIHGIFYLLRGLPADMSPEEVMSVQAAIPQNVIEVLRLGPACQALIPTVTRRPPNPDGGLGEEASILHRVIAALVLQFFITVQVILPYIKLFVGHAYRYEREHRISERVFSKGVHTMDEFGRWCVQFTHTICKMNDGKVGQAINELTIWWVRGVTGGIYQGISEGVVVLGVERSQIPWTRGTAMD
ncbi:hypothetical protein AOQ84DRAFT_442991 [Glonium stellatum]|uniref:Uncharacterized protein n=1 Tax=Glonium stellatum TaxID=574774 RepID=A0A8E2EQI7_9PEZI|nr:hypothetical protein AOQ84DRAFT_442991 [Glonium stellatum]